MKTGQRFQQSLLQNLQPLTPETAQDVDDLQAIESIIVHGVLGSGMNTWLICVTQSDMIWMILYFVIYLYRRSRGVSL